MSLLALTHAGYIAAGWTVTFVGFAAFALATFRRGRRIAEQVPPEERRWS